MPMYRLTLGDAVPDSWWFSADRTTAMVDALNELVAAYDLDPGCGSYPFVLEGEEEGVIEEGTVGAYLRLKSRLLKR